MLQAGRMAPAHGVRAILRSLSPEYALLEPPEGLFGPRAGHTIVVGPTGVYVVDEAGGRASARRAADRLRRAVASVTRALTSGEVLLVPEVEAVLCVPDPGRVEAGEGVLVTDPRGLPELILRRPYCLSPAQAAHAAALLARRLGR